MLSSFIVARYRNGAWVNMVVTELCNFCTSLLDYGIPPCLGTLFDSHTRMSLARCCALSVRRWSCCIGTHHQYPTWVLLPFISLTNCLLPVLIYSTVLLTLSIIGKHRGNEIWLRSIFQADFLKYNNHVSVVLPTTATIVPMHDGVPVGLPIYYTAERTVMVPQSQFAQVGNQVPVSATVAKPQPAVAQNSWQQASPPMYPQAMEK
jgi:hypothetical protein